MVSDRRRAPAGDLVTLAREAARLGVDRIQVREKDLSDRELRNLVAEIVQATAGTPVRVLVNGRPDVASVTGAHGVQLPEESLPVQEVRRAFPGLLLGVSCHSTQSAERAAGGGADFVLLGPIFPTPGKQGPFLGLEVLAEVSRRVGVPVHAIGGVDAERVREVRAAGARGLAAIRLFLSTPLDPALQALRMALKSPRAEGRP
jgi:thiamine-phosphate pyrophosphorylase